MFYDVNEVKTVNLLIESKKIKNKSRLLMRNLKWSVKLSSTW